MNWANRLTLGRLALTILFVLALSSTWVYGRTVALLLFILAGISDYLDGEIARRYGIVTNFGKLIDPLVDKVMMAAAFICLVPLGAVPAWVATIVVARDFLITGLRSPRFVGRNRPRRPRSSGNTKPRGKSRRSSFFSSFSRRASSGPRVEEAVWWQNAWRYGGDALLWITIGLTIYSGLGYLWRHRALILPTGLGFDDLGRAAICSPNKANELASAKANDSFASASGRDRGTIRGLNVENRRAGSLALRAACRHHRRD